MKSGRRVFLSLLLWFAPAFMLIRYLSPSKKAAGGVEIPAGRVPRNGAYLIKDRQIGVINRGGVIKAVSIACTHLGCTLNAEGERFVCPCHGSVFSLDGKVIKGPAGKDLKILRHETEGEIIRIYV